MKRYVYSRTARVEAEYKKIDYSLPDKAIDELCDSIIPNLKGNDGVNILVNCEYNDHAEQFIIECEVDSGSIITTPKGYTVDVSKNGPWYRLVLVNPKYIESKYGDIDLNNAGGNYGHLNTISGLGYGSKYNDLSYEFSFPQIRIPLEGGMDKAYTSDTASREKKPLDFNNVRRMFQEKLDRFGSLVDYIVDYNYQYAIERIEEDQLANKKRKTSSYSSKQIADAVTDYIENRLSEEDKETSFLDGDDFAWAQDEVVYYGNIPKCIAYAKKAVKEDPLAMDDISDLVYDSLKSTSNLSTIVSLFKKHGKQLPDWYFD